MAGTAALGLALAACGSEDTGSDATDEPSASESSSETTSEDAAPAADYTNDACANDASVSDTFKAGGILPLTGNLAFLGPPEVAGVGLAVSDINAAGGVNGRKLEALKEDSVNPQTASTKAERMIERDKVTCILGEISSASCLTISQVAARNKTLFVNTGGNSDALRGESCNRYMFHVEHQNSMYVKSCGRSLMAQGLVKGKKWFSLTADYAFGHDLLKVAKRFMEANGGQFAADKLVPTDATDFSALLLEIRAAKPDLVI